MNIAVQRSYKARSKTPNMRKGFRAAFVQFGGLVLLVGATVVVESGTVVSVSFLGVAFCYYWNNIQTDSA